jgi:uncharacterized protein YbjQ (UPF0145 family)
MLTSCVLLEVDWQSWLGWIREHPMYVIWGIGGLVGLVILRRILGGVGRAIRRGRPVTINPKLAKYNVDHAELDRQRRELAVGVVATTTGNRLAGFRIVRQVEAVFVEGYRTPEEAVVALKAAAVERGANAILNVQTERTTAGRCTASGDAVVVGPLVAKMPERRPGGGTPPGPSSPPQPPKTPPRG